MSFRKSLFTAALLLVGLAAPLPAQDFFFKNGDVVVVMGDSITEQRLYSNYLEMWTLSRLPEGKLVFRNVGIGGDRSTGGNSRFKRDVFAHKPTALTVDFGMNEGGYQAFKDATFDPYMKGLQGIADQAKAAKIRVAWVTPQPVERREPGPQLEGYNQTLEKFSEGVAKIAKENDGAFADQFHPYLAVMNKARETDPKIIVTGGDAVHPGPPGQALMAASILKALHFPRLVSSVAIRLNPTGLPEVKVENCKTSELGAKQDNGGPAIGAAFTQIDRALPFFPEEAKSILKWTPLLEEMNDSRLKVQGLKSGRYEIRLGGKKIAAYSAEELAQGVNIAGPALTAGPVADQVKAVWKAVQAKTNYFHDQIFRGVQLADGKSAAFKGVAPADVETHRKTLYEERMQKMPELDAAIHAALVMRPYRVEIVRAEKE
jgi:lysophospholipase L1-like esterase